MAADRHEKTYEPDIDEIASARRFARGIAMDWDFDPELVELAASELATNAVVHAATPFVVRLSRDEDLITVEVTDSSPEPPLLRYPEPTVSGGRGLLLLDGISQVWGTRTERDGGKTVWVQILRERR